jgi:NADPH:quinone reductase-like Zn-dependent oxidoreductase
LEASRLRPVIAQSYAFADAQEAYLHHQRATGFGKVVVRI